MILKPPRTMKTRDHILAIKMKRLFAFSSPVWWSFDGHDWELRRETVVWVLDRCLLLAPVFPKQDATQSWRCTAEGPLLLLQRKPLSSSSILCLVLLFLSPSQRSVWSSKFSGCGSHQGTAALSSPLTDSEHLPRPFHPLVLDARHSPGTCLTELWFLRFSKFIMKIL